MAKEPEQPKRGPGRPPYKPTEEVRGYVRRAVAAGISKTDICKILKIGHDTLVKHYSEELETAHAEATTNMANTVYNAGLKDWRAALRWLQMRAGWTAKSEVALVDDTKEENAERELLLRRAADLSGAVGDVHKQPDPEASN